MKIILESQRFILVLKKFFFYFFYIKHSKLFYETFIIDTVCGESKKKKFMRYKYIYIYRCSVLLHDSFYFGFWTADLV